MNKEELYNFILQNKMSYHRILKSKNKELYQLVSAKYKDAKNIGEAFWLYCNGYDATLKCTCGAKLLFENVVTGYKSKECKSCYKENRRKNSILAMQQQGQLNKDLPKCKNTDCDNNVTLRKDNIWSEYCSKKCRGQFNSLKSRTKAKQTMMENYGVEHALQHKGILDKMKTSNISKFGVENPMSKPDIASKVVDTKINTYGYPSSWSTKEAYQEHVDIAARRFGYESGSFSNVSQIPEVHEKKLKSSFLASEYLLPSGNCIRVQGYENLFLDKALVFYNECDIKQSVQITYLYKGAEHRYFPDFYLSSINSVVEVKSNYTFYADLEKNIEKALASVNAEYRFVFAIYNENKSPMYITYDESRKYIEDSFSFHHVTYSLFVKFGDYIVDFFIEDKNIAIHYRNTEFTNEVFVDNNYYYDMHCYFKKLGIQLIIINDYQLSSVLMKSVMSRVKKSNDIVYARNTCVSEVKKNEIVKFLNENHIQGFAPSSIKLGLYLDNELVAAMCFGRFRKGIGKDRGESAFELVRYATSKTVIGGASKLLKEFKRKYNPSLIYSYSDNSISSGNMYKVLGFSIEKELGADYKYIHPVTNRIYHRFEYRKGALEDKLPIFDKSMSETALMKLNRYRRLYDSGKITWVLR